MFVITGWMVTALFVVLLVAITSMVGPGMANCDGEDWVGSVLLSLVLTLFLGLAGGNIFNSFTAGVSKDTGVTITHEIEKIGDVYYTQEGDETSYAVVDAAGRARVETVDSEDVTIEVVDGPPRAVEVEQEFVYFAPYFGDSASEGDPKLIIQVPR